MSYNVTTMNRATVREEDCTDRLMYGVYNRRPCRLAAAATTTTHKHDWRRSLQFFATVFYVDPRDRARGVLDSFNTTAHAHHILRGEGSRTQGYGKAYGHSHSYTRSLDVLSRARGVRKASSGETLN